MDVSELAINLVARDDNRNLTVRVSAEAGVPEGCNVDGDGERWSRSCGIGESDWR